VLYGALVDLGICSVERKVVSCITVQNTVFCAAAHTHDESSIC
jgi:hypothetical protein